LGGYGGGGGGGGGAGAGRTAAVPSFSSSSVSSSPSSSSSSSSPSPCGQAATTFVSAPTPPTPPPLVGRVAVCGMIHSNGCFAQCQDARNSHGNSLELKTHGVSTAAVIAEFPVKDSAPRAPSMGATAPHPIALPAPCPGGRLSGNAHPAPRWGRKGSGHAVRRGTRDEAELSAAKLL